MTIFQSVILGIIQGASEFIPISSSGHLVLAPFLFGWEIAPKEAFIFDVLVQVATLLAVIIFFWSDLRDIGKALVKGLLEKRPFQSPKARLGWLLVLATIPAGLAALLFKEKFEAAFSSPRSSAAFLIATSLILIVGELIGKRIRNLDQITWVDALAIGVIQVLALFPGISRSGSTITGGLLRNFDRKSAARFSFLMSVPVMLAAGLLAFLDLINSPDLWDQLLIYLPGFAAAAVVGYLAISWFISYLSRQSLYIFAGYCALFGSLMLYLTWA